MVETETSRPAGDGDLLLETETYYYQLWKRRQRPDRNRDGDLENRDGGRGQGGLRDSWKRRCDHGDGWMLETANMNEMRWHRMNEMA